MKKKLMLLSIILMSMSLIGGTVKTTAKTTQTYSEQQSGIAEDKNISEPNKSSDHTEDTKTADSKNSKSVDDKYHIGDTIHLFSDNGKELELVLDSAEREYNSYYSKIMYALHYTVINNGKETASFGYSDFTFYGDDYLIETGTFGGDTNDHSEVTIAPGRKAKAVVFCSQLPGEYTSFEAQIGNDVIIDLSSAYNDNYVIDEASLLDDAQLKALTEKLQNENKKNNFDIVFLTVESIDSGDIQSFSDDYYDYNNYRPNGVILVISMGDRMWHLTTTGSAIGYFSDKKQEEIMSIVTPELAEGDYYSAFNTFADLCLETFSEYNK